MAAARIGAANTLIWRREGGWLADNTDAGGFAMTLDWDDVAIAGRPVILLGAGGSARAVAYTLAQRGARLTIANRTAQRAEQIVKRLAPEARAVPLAEGLERLSEAELVINTLSLGHQGQSLSLPAARGGLFYDISYGAAARPMLEEAARRNWRTRDGLGMLVAQAALSFELWFGIRPDTQGALQEVRRIVGVVG
jgi:shikimate dehydrogenase